MLFPSDERFHESSASCSTSPEFMPQKSFLSSTGGVKMLEPWFQGSVHDVQEERCGENSVANPVVIRGSDLDLIKPRPPSFAFSKASKFASKKKEEGVIRPAVPICDPSEHSSHSNRIDSPVNFFGTSSRMKATSPPFSNTPNISIESADRAYKVILPAPVSHKFSGTSRKTKLDPSTTPGPGQYQPLSSSSARTVTFKSRTKLFGHTLGDDSPGPNNYEIMNNTMLKKSFNVRANECSSNDKAPRPSSALKPCPPREKANSKHATPTRARNICHASDFIAENSQEDNCLSSPELTEHFSKNDVKEQRSLFKNLLLRSNEIIRQTAVEKVIPSHDHDQEGSVTSGKESYFEDVVGNQYNVGDKVICNFCDEGQWCPGTIVECRTGGLYDIQYDDGDFESNRNERAIRKAPNESVSIVHFPHCVGTKVLGNFEEMGIWFEGILSAINKDGEKITFDVDYIDGDTEYEISGKHIILNQ